MTRLGDNRTLTIAVASGKGGTGKTLISTNLAWIAAEAGHSTVLADCDVEAPNDHLFLPTDERSEAPVEVPVAEVDGSVCDACGLCREACAYGAVRVLGGSAVVFEELCHGCGACVDTCPTGALREQRRVVGTIFTGAVRGREKHLRLVTGELRVGDVKTPNVIKAVKRHAEEPDADVAIFDAPPGVACAAVAAIRRADVLVLVTEPTPFAVHDLALSLDLGKDMGIPMGVVLNRDGTGDEDVASLCEDRGVALLGRIPFDRRIAKAYADGRLVQGEVPELDRTLRAVLDFAAAQAAPPLPQVFRSVR